jgi:hypothetical protein
MGRSIGGATNRLADAEFSAAKAKQKSAILDTDVAKALRDDGFWQKGHTGEGVANWNSIPSTYSSVAPL